MDMLNRPIEPIRKLDRLFVRYLGSYLDQLLLVHFQGYLQQADKFAWDLWSYLLANGYSKAAAAGILGNVQGEVGPSMNPDTYSLV
jgi:hypothetical protein